ncbi:molybdopterin-dependent oxidoreductase [Ferrovibrio sp.]|uniref:molybdopterin-dependent oxidoreductase n=1 Tax=Ferrovibrio sp. TaxID=1917215 RepID=UPI00351440F1
MRISSFISGVPGFRPGTGCLGLAVLLLALLLARGAVADTLPQPGDAVVLTVAGKISRSNGQDAAGRPEARFDLAMLQHLGITEFVTATPWHRGRVRFEGVLVRRLLEEVGASGDRLYAVAHNEYTANIPRDDAVRYDMILALRANGHQLGLRDKGPVFIVYPYDTDAALRSDVMYSRSVWQLRRLEIQ